jgi:homospermidine synthase
MDQETMRKERRERKKQTKWMRGMPRNLILSILNQNPKSVSFLVEHGKYVVCEVITQNGARGRGVAICSVEDKKVFEVSEGKKKAAGRAIKALVRKDNSFKMRREFSEFPNTWSKEQIKQGMKYADMFTYLSKFEKGC